MKQAVEKKDQQHRSVFQRSLLTTAIYAFFGYLWIIATELVLTRFHTESAEVFLINISKGLAFVTATAALIFILVYTNLHKVYHESIVRQESEAALKEAQHLAHIGNFSYDTKNEQFQFSGEAARILNLENSEEPISLNAIGKYVQVNDSEHVFALAKKVKLNDKETVFDCRIILANKTERTIQVRLQRVSQKGKTETSLIGTLQDITERADAEDAARVNEAIYKALLNSSYDLVYLKDSSLRYIAINTNMQQYYGISEEKLIGKMLHEIKPGPDALLWEARDKRVLLSGKPIFIEDSYGDQYFETIIYPVDFANQKRGVGGISRDITQRRETEREVAKERDRAQTYFDMAAVLFAVFDREGNVMMINHSGCELIGLPKEKIIGKQWIENFVPEQDRAGVYDVMHGIYNGSVMPTDVNENGIITANNEIRQLEWRNTVLQDGNNEITGILSAGIDVTDLRRTIGALKESERSKSVLLSNLPGMAYRSTFDPKWTIQFASTGCFELTGYLPEEIVNDEVITFSDIICPEYLDMLRAKLAEHLVNRENNRFEYEIITASGERKWVLDSSQWVADENGNFVALEGIIVDITTSKLQFLQIQYLSNHDQLTGLHNRLYYDAAKKMFDSPKFLPLSICFVDINGLKLINDAFGYDIGDQIIQTTATTLKAKIKPNEVIARIGGDEFSLLMPNTDAQACEKRMQTLKDVFSARNEKVKDRAMVINLSFGYATRLDEAVAFSEVEKDAEANLARRKLFDQKSHHNAVLSSIMATLFERSFETKEHADRIGRFSTIIGKRLSLSQDDLDRLRLFALLHDIGKIGISDQILNKPAALNEDELALMRTHPEIGYRIAMASPELATIADLILAHHERWDGEGYPNHIAGEKIPLLSRILAVTDAYDAMTEDRVYRKAMMREEAMDEIRKNSGTQFDPHIASVFLEILEQENL